MGIEKRLANFEPDFEFTPVNPLPREEFEERVRIIKREAVVDECDALVFHTNLVGWYHTSNGYIRYVCDWMRDGVLILPIDEDKEPTLLTFINDSVLLPPPGEPTWFDDIRQTGLYSREAFNIPGDQTKKVAEATRLIIKEKGLLEGKFGLIGDFYYSTPFFSVLKNVLPEARGFISENKVINRMQHIKSPREQELERAAAQLVDIGIQAAYHICKPGVTDHELYAAFTLAQMSRGGEQGDGYQIGVNRWGTHISKPYGHVVKSGDIIIFYISGVTYRGYKAQTARMFVVGDITRKQEEVIEMCVDAVQRAEKAAGPGVLVRDVNNAAFEAYIERGYLSSPEAKDIPWNWEPNPDGTPRPFPVEKIHNEDWERMGRDLRHVYPATFGPNGCRMGHSMGFDKMPLFHIISSNYMKLQPGMTYIVHAQWFEPKVAGCNLGNFMLVTENGVENLNKHSSLEPYRIIV
jgi:Xaa-Pro aminopeptidase